MDTNAASPADQNFPHVIPASAVDISEAATPPTPPRTTQMIKNAKMIRIFMILSLLIDVLLLLISLVLFVPSYQALVVAHDTFLDDEFHRWFQSNTVAESGIYVAYIMAALCPACLIMDVWCFLTAKTIRIMPTNRQDCRFDPVWMWAAVSWPLLIVAVIQLKIQSKLHLHETKEGGGDAVGSERETVRVLSEALAFTLIFTFIRTIVFISATIRLKFGAERTPTAAATNCTDPEAPPPYTDELGEPLPATNF